MTQDEYEDMMAGRAAKHRAEEREAENIEAHLAMAAIRELRYLYVTRHDGDGVTLDHVWSLLKATGHL